MKIQFIGTLKARQIASVKVKDKGQTLGSMCDMYQILCDHWIFEYKYFFIIFYWSLVVH